MDTQTNYPILALVSPYIVLNLIEKSRREKPGKRGGSIFFHKEFSRQFPDISFKLFIFIQNIQE